MDSGMSLRVAHLYPDVMNIYGDRGNVIAFKMRCEARGIGIEVDEVNVGDPFDAERYDILLVGGGQDREQRRIADDLVAKGESIRAAADAGMPGLAVCGGFQMFGTRYIDAAGDIIPGIGIFQVESRSPGEGAERCIGDIVIDTEWGEIVGFENHGGRSYLEPGQDPLGKVRHGHGNKQGRPRGRALQEFPGHLSPREPVAQEPAAGRRAHPPRAPAQVRRARGAAVARRYRRGSGPPGGGCNGDEAREEAGEPGPLIPTARRLAPRTPSSSPQPRCARSPASATRGPYRRWSQVPGRHHRRRSRSRRPTPSVTCEG
ncbi:MAG: glutamine amidotransferase [Dehalococcoidia bacterium]|nr:glutamine amidotransferase [Dehalococcoidia bacterium]